MSAAAAHAKPTFVVTDTQARAGDAVRFSITGAEGRVTYELEINDRDVLEGITPGGGPFTGTFTMPDLGDSRRSVTVEAELRDSRKHKKIKHKLDYLGRALPVAEPPARAEPPRVELPSHVEPPAPSVAPQAAPPTPVPAPQLTTAPASAAPAPAAREPHRARQGRGPRTSKQRRSRSRPSAGPRTERRARKRVSRDGDRKQRRGKRPPPRTAPLFDGVPEQGAGPNGTGGASALEAIAPRPAVLAAAAADSSDSFALKAAVLVPALLALAGLGLAGVAMRRSRSRRS